MKPQRSVLVIAMLAVLSGTALAADHRDSPFTTGDPAADINDVYTFTNPNNADELIVVATVSPVANSNTRFSDAVEYRIHLDNGVANGTTTITCTFPQDATRVLCRNGGDTLYADGPLNQIVDADDLRVWAGLRDDPFFFDLDAFNRTKATLVPSFTDPGVNFFAGLNTLAIVLGIEHDRLTNNGANPVLKVYSSTNRIGDAGIGAGISGIWRDSANPGHGVILEVLDGGPDDAPNRLMAYWNVFTPTGNQLNLYGVGDIPNNTTGASVPVVSASGGNFPPATVLGTTQQFGTLNFSFTDCNTGSMAVAPTRPGYSAVTVPLQRLTSIVDVPCSFNRLGQIDRMGRPGINTALIDLLASTGKKEAYNQAVDPAGWAASFQTEIQNNLAALDTLDGTTGNAVLPAASLAPVLVDDRLLVDTSKPACDAYLAVELGVTTQCGGRTLARDVIDDTLGAVVGPGVKDNVANDSTFLADFPFVGPSN
jgi:hypothetical protein